MATRSVKARVEVDGEKKYKSAIAEINRGNKVLTSEMQKLQAQFKGNEGSIEALTAKGDLLGRQLLEQQAKVSETRKALEAWQEKLEKTRTELGASSDAYKAAQAKVQEWQAALNKAETGQIQLERAVKENAEALEYQSSETKKAKDFLAELDSTGQMLESEMRKLQAQFKGNEDSTEALTAKGELLERQLEKQRDRTRVLREELEKAAKEYGDADERTRALAIELNNAEAAEYDLEHAIRENNNAMQDQGDKVFGLGDGLDDLAGKLGVNIPDAAKKALNGVGDFSAATVAKLGIVAGAVAAVVSGVKKLQDITLESAAKADEILTESMTTGLSTRTLQELRYAEQFVDVSTGTFTGALTKLTRNIYDAANGNDKMAESFRSLGVSIRDGNGELRSAESVFYDVIDALGQKTNVTERDAQAMELLGKSAQELNPLFLIGSAGLQKFMDTAEEAGYVLDESQLQKLGEVDDAYQKLQLQIEATKDELALQFAPGSAQAMETFAKVVTEGGKALTNSGIIKGLGEILASLSGMLEPLAAVIGLIPNATKELQPIYQILHAIAGVIAWIADAGNAAIGLLTAFTASGRERWRTAMGENAQYGQFSNIQRWQGKEDAWNNAASSMSLDTSTGLYSGNYGTPNNMQQSTIYWDNLNGVYRESGSGKIYTPEYNGQPISLDDLETLADINGWNASGNDNWRGGLTYLSENGPETAVLPSGTKIFSAQDTELMGGDTFNFTVDVRSLEDLQALIRWAKSVRVRERMR